MFPNPHYSAGRPPLSWSAFRKLIAHSFWKDSLFVVSSGFIGTWFEEQIL